MRALFVARLVDRLEDLFAELARVGEDVVQQVRRQLAEIRQVAVLALGAWVAAKLCYSTTLPYPIVLLATGVAPESATASS